MKKTKKILSIMLAVMMILTAVPLTGLTAFAEEHTHVDANKDNICDECEKELYIVRSWDDTKKKVVETLKEIPADAETLESSEDTVTLEGKTYVVSGDVSMSANINVKGTSDAPTILILKDGSKLNASESIYIDAYCVLIICAQAKDSGNIEAINGNGGIQIYSPRTSATEMFGTLTINGGTITAKGTSSAAIGGFRSSGSSPASSGGFITINGGIVTATTTTTGAAIGGGGTSSVLTGSGRDGCGTITINGGVVTATSGSDGGAGIGSGKYGIDSNVVINGGTVTATGNGGGAGIGGGLGRSNLIGVANGGTVTVNGGTVTATGSSDSTGDAVSAGIGAGAYGQDQGTLTIAGNVIVKAGDAAPGTETTAADYITARSMYVYIGTPHTHTFSTKWATNTTAHWHECTAADCNIEDYATSTVDGIAYGTHTWENGKCSVCDYECTHSFVDGVCEICGEKEFDLDAYKQELYDDLAVLIDDNVPYDIQMLDSFQRKVLGAIPTAVGAAETKDEVDKIRVQVFKIVDEFIPEKYTVTANGGTLVSQKLNLEKSTKYEIATVTIKEANGIDGNGNWFVYWKDQDGKIVSTYSTYSFFVVENRTLTPVYVSPSVYETERAKGILVTDIVRAEDNGDGTATIFSEHSASKAAVGGEIAQHGVIYTTEASQSGSLTIDNDNVNKSVATKTNKALTGLFRANVDVEENDVVYARSYLVDANGNTVYGEVKTVNIGSFTTSGFDSEIITCGSFDSTLAQADEIIVSAEDVPTQEETETAPTFMSILMSILNAVVALFQTIIALF